MRVPGWCVLVAGGETDESLSAWLRAAAAADQQSSESERGARETDKNAGGAEECSGRQEDSAEGVVRRGDRRTGHLLGRFFSHIGVFLWIGNFFSYYFSFFPNLVFFKHLQRIWQIDLAFVVVCQLLKSNTKSKNRSSPKVLAN